MPCSWAITLHLTNLCTFHLKCKKIILLSIRGVSHCGIAIYIKIYIKEKKQNYGNSNISSCKNIIFKKFSKRNQNPSRYYYNSIITNLKLQHRHKISSFKNPHIKNIPIITKKPKSLRLLYSIMNLNTTSLPWQERPTNNQAPLLSMFVAYPSPKFHSMFIIGLSTLQPCPPKVA